MNTVPSSPAYGVPHQIECVWRKPGWFGVTMRFPAPWGQKVAEGYAANFNSQAAALGHDERAALLPAEPGHGVVHLCVPAELIPHWLGKNMLAPVWR